SRVAQWKRAGPITQRSEDQNLALLFLFFFLSPLSFRVAQWKRAGPITQRSEDQNLALLFLFFYIRHSHYTRSRVAQWKRAGPITQRSEDQNLALLFNQSGAVEACWAHNPEVRGSKPRSAKGISLFHSFLKIWKRAGPITQRSEDQNLALLIF
ncbi:unnamed protein product, partial [Porites lobata]